MELQLAGSAETLSGAQVAGRVKEELGTPLPALETPTEYGALSRRSCMRWKFLERPSEDREGAGCEMDEEDRRRDTVARLAEVVRGSALDKSGMLVEHFQGLVKGCLLSGLHVRLRCLTSRLMECQ